MNIYTESEIQALYEVEISTIAISTYQPPELSLRLTDEIAAKRGQIEAKKQNRPNKKSIYERDLRKLESDLQELITQDAAIDAANQAARDAAMAATNGAKSIDINQAAARANTVNQILRESDWIVAVDSKVSETDFNAWYQYRLDLRTWAATGGSIPESPAIPRIDTEAETLMDRIVSTDDAIIAILEMMR